MAHKNENAKYRLLINEIKSKILSGELKGGQKLGSENELTEQYGYSRQTIRQAFGVLENEGLIYRIRGSGTYVRDDKLPSRSRSYQVGVIATYMSDYIFPYIINGIEDELTPEGYHITLGVTKNKLEEESRILHSFLNMELDGIIVEGTKSAFPNPNIELYEKIREKGIPVVFFNSFYPELQGIPYVVTDDKNAGKMATDYIIECGSKKLGGIFKSDDMQGHRRYSGFASSIVKHGLEFTDDSIIWYTTSDESRFTDEAYASYILSAFKDCDGIVCYNDKIAARLIKLLTENGVKIPEEKMIISFDNSSVSEYAKVRISSMDHPKEALGRAAARRLIEMIEMGKSSGPYIMQMELIEKDSTYKK